MQAAPLGGGRPRGQGPLGRSGVVKARADMLAEEAAVQVSAAVLVGGGRVGKGRWGRSDVVEAMAAALVPKKISDVASLF